MDDGEQLLTFGTARTVEGAGVKTEGYSYYFVTDRGLHFGGTVETGFLKKETRAAFVPSGQVVSGDIQGPYDGSDDMAFLSCADQTGQRTLWISFDDIAGNPEPPTELAVKAGEALGLRF